MTEWTCTCEEARERLPDRGRGRLAPREEAALEAHLTACADCASEARLVGVLLASRPAPPPELGTRIRVAVSADAAGRQLAKLGGRGPRTRWLGVPRWILAATAALVLALGTGLYWHDVTGGGAGDVGAVALGDAALDPVPDPWIDDDAVVAGAPVLDGLSADALAALLEEM